MRNTSSLLFISYPIHFLQGTYSRQLSLHFSPLIWCPPRHLPTFMFVRCGIGTIYRRIVRRLMASCCYFGFTMIYSIKGIKMENYCMDNGCYCGVCSRKSIKHYRIYLRLLSTRWQKHTSESIASAVAEICEVVEGRLFARNLQPDMGIRVSRWVQPLAFLIDI